MLKGATVHFLSNWRITFFKHLYTLLFTLWYVTMQCNNLIDCVKHLKKIRSNQASISINSYTELGKTQFLPVTIVIKFKIDEIFITWSKNINIPLRKIPKFHLFLLWKFCGKVQSPQFWANCSLRSSSICLSKFVNF